MILISKRIKKNQLCTTFHGKQHQIGSHWAVQWSVKQNATMIYFCKKIMLSIWKATKIDLALQRQCIDFKSPKLCIYKKMMQCITTSEAQRCIKWETELACHSLHPKTFCQMHFKGCRELRSILLIWIFCQFYIYDYDSSYDICRIL